MPVSACSPKRFHASGSGSTGPLSKFSSRFSIASCMPIGPRESNFVSHPEKVSMDEQSFTVGQLAGPGTYRCTACGKETIEYSLSFEIEPCSCGNVTFLRVD